MEGRGSNVIPRPLAPEAGCGPSGVLTRPMTEAQVKPPRGRKGRGVDEVCVTDPVPAQGGVKCEKPFR